MSDKRKQRIRRVMAEEDCSARTAANIIAKRVACSRAGHPANREPLGPKCTDCGLALRARDEVRTMTHADRKTPRAGEAPACNAQEVARYGDWIVERGTFDEVTCPGCAFSFNAVHTDGVDGVYSCPVCEEARLREVIKTGGAMYRAERAAMGIPGGLDASPRTPEATPAEPQETALAQEQILSTYGETFRRLAESDGPPPPADLAERARALSRTVARLYGGADPSPVVTAAIEWVITAAYHDGLETGCALPCGHCPEPDLIAEAEARGRAEEREKWSKK